MFTNPHTYSELMHHSKKLLRPVIRSNLMQKDLTLGAVQDLMFDMAGAGENFRERSLPSPHGLLQSQLPHRYFLKVLKNSSARYS